MLSFSLLPSISPSNDPHAFALCSFLQIIASLLFHTGFSAPFVWAVRLGFRRILPLSLLAVPGKEDHGRETLSFLSLPKMISPRRPPSVLL